jgi:hypothetical protein
MAERRVSFALSLFGLFLSHCFYFKEHLSVCQPAFKPSLLLFSYRSAGLKAPIIKQHKHGSTVVSLPFNTAVTLRAYFALCCDVLPNTGPTLQSTNEFQQPFNHKSCPRTKNAVNFINVNIKKATSYYSSHIRFGTWNAHSLNKKSAAICDLIISKRIDVLTITESWLLGDHHSNNTIAEMLNTLKDYDFHHVLRINRAGGGVVIFLRKTFKVSKNACQPFSSMEYMDLVISHGNSSIRLITIIKYLRYAV